MSRALRSPTGSGMAAKYLIHGLRLKTPVEIIGLGPPAATQLRSLNAQCHSETFNLRTAKSLLCLDSILKVPCMQFLPALLVTAFFLRPSDCSGAKSFWWICASTQIRLKTTPHHPSGNLSAQP